MAISIFLALTGVVVVVAVEETTTDAVEAEATSGGMTTITTTTVNNNNADTDNNSDRPEEWDEDYYYNYNYYQEGDDDASLPEEWDEIYEEYEYLQYYDYQNKDLIDDGNNSMDDGEEEGAVSSSDEDEMSPMEIELEDEDLDRIIAELEANNAIKQRGGSVLTLEEQIGIMLEEKYQRRLSDKLVELELEFVENLADSWGGEFDKTLE